jgi:acyl carrier protein
MDDAMRDKIIEFIRDEYVEDEATEIAADTPLITGGLVDSFSMVSLKMFLEDEYKVQLSDEEATTESFNTVGSIVALMQGKLAK